MRKCTLGLTMILAIGCGSSSSLPIGDGAVPPEAAAGDRPSLPADGAAADAAGAVVPDTDAGGGDMPAPSSDVIGGGYADPGLAVSPTYYAFPTTAIGTDSPVAGFTVSDLALEATGPISHIVDGVNSSEFIIVASTCGQPLAYLASCQLSLIFRPLTAGSKSARLTVSATPAKSFTVLLAATAGAPAGLDAGPPAGMDPAQITLTPTSQSFGDVPIGMKSAFAFDVKNVGGAEAGKISYSLEGINISEFTVVPDASCAVPLRPGFTCSMIVTFTPMRPGPKTASLRVTASPGGFAKADLTASALMMTTDTTINLSSPSPDPFGTVEVGKSSTGVFVVKNTGTMIAAGKVMPVISGSNASEFAITDNACPAMLGPGASCGLTVTFTPLLAGRRTANLQVTAFPGGFAILPISATAR
jgi:hypothetical protein